jgi:hypothetical protein
MFNDAFNVRRCVVKQKEKIMIASYGETSGFTPVSCEDLQTVNGGDISPMGIKILLDFFLPKKQK